MSSALKKIIYCSLISSTTLFAITNASAYVPYNKTVVTTTTTAPCPPPRPVYKDGCLPPQLACNQRYKNQCCYNMLRGLQDGFYIGAAAGYDSYRVRNNISVTDGAGSTVSATMIPNAVGFVAGAFGGFGKNLGQMLYLGGEVFANWSRANVTQNVSLTTPTGGVSFSDKITVKNTYGISLIPAIYLNPFTRMYGRVGYSRSRFRNTVTAPFGISSTANNWSTGLHYGAGLETNIYQNLSMRAEYTHTNYNKFTQSGVRVYPNNNEGMVGLLVHFG